MIKKLSNTTGIALIICIITGNWSNELRISQEGLELIGRFEGVKYTPYLDSASILTVGIGHTQNIENRTYSTFEIARFFFEDIRGAEQCIIKFASNDLPQPVFDATVSIVFNLGCTAMRRSTLFYYLRKGHYKKACDEFPRFIYSNQRIVRGLKIRRSTEKQLCLTGI